jgi:hypothetical protein
VHRSIRPHQEFAMKNNQPTTQREVSFPANTYLVS